MFDHHGAHAFLIALEVLLQGLQGGQRGARLLQLLLQPAEDGLILDQFAPVSLHLRVRAPQGLLRGGGAGQATVELLGLTGTLPAQRFQRLLHGQPLALLFRRLRSQPFQPLLMALARVDQARVLEYPIRPPLPFPLDRGLELADARTQVHRLRLRALHEVRFPPPNP